jgi:integrase
LEVLLTMAIVTGMRRGELLALKWSNIDLERRVLVVVATVDFVPKYGFIENKPKTKAGQRAIYLPPFLVEMLREHKAKQDKRRQEIGANWEDRNLVFPNTHGGYWYPSAMCRLFAKMLEQAGLPPIHFHDLRHSAATILLSMGVNIKIIQELLGHSNVSITLGTYSHLLPTMQQVSAATMSDLFGEK